MDLELLHFRSKIIQGIRSFFADKNYLEADTPALSPTLIPETCLEVFKTEYIATKNHSEKNTPLYLVPSPEIYIKKIIAQHKTDIFQVSKCYRNSESVGRIHNPEFTMLEYYTMNADYIDSMHLTENLFDFLCSEVIAKNQIAGLHIHTPFLRLTMDEAFSAYAGFALSDCKKEDDLARHALRLGLHDPQNKDFLDWSKDDLYELILVHNVEPNLPKEPVFLSDYPDFVPCLAKHKAPMWSERWELYINGIELANCYTEQSDAQKVKQYFKNESLLKHKNAKVDHATDNDYWKIFSDFPLCSGVAMGVDRLIAILAGFSSIEPIMPCHEDFFSLR